MGDMTVNGAVVDCWGNAVVISGDMDRVVTTGAAYRTPGNEARTGLTGQGMAVHTGTRWVVVADDQALADAERNLNAAAAQQRAILSHLSRHRPPER